MHSYMLCTLLLAFAALGCSSTQDPSSNAAPSPRLTYLGEYGNKRYYLEDVLHSWNSGRQACESNGLTLVDLETRDEVYWLYSLLPRNYFWTSVTETYYKFDEYYHSANTGVRLESLTSSFIGMSAGRLNCGALDTIDETPWWAFMPCTSAYPVICQNSTTIAINRAKDPEMSRQRPERPVQSRVN